MTEHHYIEVKDLVKNYGTGNREVNAVDHVSFYVNKGEFIGIMMEIRLYKQIIQYNFFFMVLSGLWV